MPDPNKIMSLLGSVGTAAQPVSPTERSGLGWHKRARQRQTMTLSLPADGLLFPGCSSL